MRGEAKLFATRLKLHALHLVGVGIERNTIDRHGRKKGRHGKRAEIVERQGGGGYELVYELVKGKA
eukprot:8777509-Alexandrium_andersonii.AAC.1